MYLINIKKLEKESVYIKYDQIGKTWLKIIILFYLMKSKKIKIINLN